MGLVLYQGDPEILGYGPGRSIYGELESFGSKPDAQVTEFQSRVCAFIS